MKTLNEFVHNNYVSLEGIEESLLKSISNLFMSMYSLSIN